MKRNFIIIGNAKTLNRTQTFTQCATTSSGERLTEDMAADFMRSKIDGEIVIIQSVEVSEEEYQRILTRP